MIYLHNVSLQSKLDCINSDYESKIRICKDLIEKEKTGPKTIESDISISLFEDKLKRLMKEWDVEKSHVIKYYTDSEYRKKYDEEQHKKQQELYVKTHDKRKNTKCRFTKEKYKRLKCKK